MNSLGPEIDTIHFLGGGYLSDAWEKHYLLLAIAEYLKSISGARLIMTGAGIAANTPHLRYDILPHIAQFDYASARDTGTLELLSQAGVSASQTGDDAFLGLVREPTVERHRTSRSLILCLQRDLFDAGVYGDISTALLHKMREDWSNIQIWQMQVDSDDWFIRFARDMGIAFKLFDYNDCIDVAMTSSHSLNDDAECIGSRFHFHLFHSWMGRKGAFISSGSYYDSKHGLLTELGTNWTIFPNVAVKGPVINRHKLSESKRVEANSLYSI